ncbi:MAG: L-2-amino-thiazoline-4-carboxylic acid hydrolase [Geminicoccaceae bacterium]|nr:L-2-amino-thiazoline-4-carboxylic acid hydrolase [Geminicoccaceae bacterium]
MPDETLELRRQLKEAHMSRALVYAAFYDALVKRHGEAEAEAIMKDAIHRRGLEIGRRFQAYGPADLDGLKVAFLDFVPDKGRLFQPEVKRSEPDGLDIKFHACPLKEAWQQAGLAPEKIRTLCRIAGVVDNGTFEAAGFAFSAETWQPGDDGCCFLHIRPGRRSG